MPAFRLMGSDGERYSATALRGHSYVVYFYPRDNTPGCTREACDFRDLHPSFVDAGVKVLGVSGDSLTSHASFQTKLSLPFVLLSDPEHAMAKAFGAYGEKKLYGKVSLGIIRSTFVINRKGVVTHVESPVRVDGHAARVLARLAT